MHGRCVFVYVCVHGGLGVKTNEKRLRIHLH